MSPTKVAAVPAVMPVRFWAESDACEMKAMPHSVFSVRIRVSRYH
jgi:hypothetical protein